MLRADLIFLTIIDLYFISIFINLRLIGNSTTKVINRELVTNVINELFVIGNIKI